MSINMEQKFKKLLIKYGTARIDFKNVGTYENHTEIININGEITKIENPGWFDDECGVGTSIESNQGSLDLEIKCVNSGIFIIWLKGIDYRDKNTNRFPIYIDYTNLELNGDKIFTDNKVVWHDNPYTFKKNVRNGEILKLHIEWLPFNYNTSYYNNEELYQDKNNEIKSLKDKLTKRENQIKSIPQLSATSFGFPVLNGKLIYRNWLGLKKERSLMNDFDGFCENIWFTKYLKHKFPEDDFKIYLHGVFNPHDNITYPTEGKKVLYCGEELHYRFMEMRMHFDMHVLEYMDFSMGFDLIEHFNYLRFPYWLITHFSPTVTDEEIENIVSSWNSSHYEKTKNIAAIASHDFWGTRTLISNDINNLVNIDYAGNWRNNTHELHEKFRNNKKEFLKQYKFNLCPENIISEAYVTEKIFDAIHCDCIPLYAGAGDYLEPKVINSNAIIRWDGDPIVIHDQERKRRGYYGYDVNENVTWVAEDSRNSDSIELFKNLLTDEKSYNEFKDQDKVLDSSTKFIIKKFKELETHFERLIYS